MSGIRSGFARVDVLVFVLDILRTSESLQKVNVVDAYDASMDGEEFIWPGHITGQIQQPLSRSGRAIDDDEFTIPLHVGAWNADAQQTSIDARLRCQQIMDAIRDVVAAHANTSIPGVLYLVNAGADGPDVEPVKDPTGWVADGVARVFCRARMK